MINELKSLLPDNCFFAIVDLNKDIDLIESRFDLLPDKSEKFAHKRKIEYVAGRICAERALSQLGIESFILKSGDKREPLWPSGVVGSITHNKNFAICIVSKELNGVGIDIEEIMDDERFDKLKSQFLSDIEQNNYSFNAKTGTLIFSAKETLFKALYPHVMEHFGFMDAQVLEITDYQVTLKLLRKDDKFQSFDKPLVCKYFLFKSDILTFLKIS